VDDVALVERQLGRRPRAFRRVVVRCSYGRPAVTEQAPFDESGRPFPTTYWLTCPFLVAALARVEAAGGVERWTRVAAEDPELRASLERAHEEQRALRPELAHAAFALARPGYELGERILAEVEPLWPPDGCCTSDSVGGKDPSVRPVVPDGRTGKARTS
jgi:hypothetical protein